MSEVGSQPHPPPPSPSLFQSVRNMSSSSPLPLPRLNRSQTELFNRSWKQVLEQQPAHRRAHSTTKHDMFVLLQQHFRSQKHNRFHMKTCFIKAWVNQASRCNSSYFTSSPGAMQNMQAKQQTRSCTASEVLLQIGGSGNLLAPGQMREPSTSTTSETLQTTERSKQTRRGFRNPYTIILKRQKNKSKKKLHRTLARQRKSLRKAKGWVAPPSQLNLAREPKGDEPHTEVEHLKHLLLTVSSHNTRGINKIGKRQEIWNHITSQGIHIFALQETKLAGNQFEDMPTHTLYFSSAVANAMEPHG
eukprot:6472202-Amphidinium_carterae.1